MHQKNLQNNNQSILKQEISNIYLSACCYDLSNGAQKELWIRKLVLLYTVQKKNGI